MYKCHLVTWNLCFCAHFYSVNALFDFVAHHGAASNSERGIGNLYFYVGTCGAVTPEPVIECVFIVVRSRSDL